jgi:hypothetical protein
MRKSALVILTSITFCWLSRAEGSVVFPRDNDLFSRLRRNPRTREDAQSRKSQRLGLPMSTFQYRQSQVPAAANYPRIPLAFSGVNVLGRSGSWLLAAAALVQVSNCLRSEALSRAVHFWVKAGPIVAHYKFTSWWLRKIKAPLEKRDDVYNILHNRYCNPSLDLVLDLKGLYVKVCKYQLPLYKRSEDLQAPTQHDVYTNFSGSRLLKSSQVGPTLYHPNILNCLCLLKIRFLSGTLTRLSTF